MNCLREFGNDARRDAGKISDVPRADMNDEVSLARRRTEFVEIDEILDDEHAALGAIIIRLGMLGAVANAAPIDADHSHLARRDLLDQRP